MSEQDKQGDAENITSHSPDSLSADTSTTQESETTIDDSEFESEESDSTLDIDKELSVNNNKETASTKSADEQRQKQVQSWKTRWENGDVSKEDIPKWIQKELDYEESEPDLDARIDAKVQEKLKLTQDAQAFSDIKSKLSSVKITASQKSKILDRFQELSGALPKGKALEIAIEAAGVSLATTVKRPKSMNAIKQAGMKTQGAIPKDANYGEIQKNHSEDDRRKYLIEATKRD